MGNDLVAIMPEVPRRLEYFGEFKCDARTREKLLKISAATIDRLLAPERASISCEAAAHARIYEIESSGAETKDRADPGKVIEAGQKRQTSAAASTASTRLDQRLLFRQIRPLRSSRFSLEAMILIWSRS